MNKKAILLAFSLLTTMLFVPVSAKSPNKMLGSPRYVLNLLGKKDGWSPNGDFDNPDRHTIFIPEDGQCNLTMRNGEEFAVVDGNGCDGEAVLELEKGRYQVFIAVKGKPGFTTDIAGVFEYSEDGLLNLVLDSISIRKRDDWVNCTELFIIEWSEVLAILEALGISVGYEIGDDMTPEELAEALGVEVGQDVWILDFVDFLETLDEYGLYFWQIDNNGNKHLQVRFY